MTNEEKELVSIYADQAFRGQTIRQQPLQCPKCGKKINEKEIYDAPGVYFEDVTVYGKVFILIEPICRTCNIKIPATWSIIN